MNSVGLSQTCNAPLIHGFQTSHNFELVPHSTTCFIGKTIKNISSQWAIRMCSVGALFHPTITIVVGNENKSTIGIHGTDGIDEAQIISPEYHRVKIRAKSIIDANAKDN